MLLFWKSNEKYEKRYLRQPTLMNHSILVSVCAITYNHEEYIVQAIESILSQKTNFTFELVIGEDYSTDNTRKIVLDFKARYPDKIKLLLQEKNVGMMQNFIDTLNTCSGTYIALCEGDDYWSDPYKLQKQVNFLETNNVYQACYHNTIDRDENSSKSKVAINAEVNCDVDLVDLISNRCDIKILSLVMRNNFTLPIFFKDLAFGDCPLCITLAEKGKIKYIDEIMGTYRYWKGDDFKGVYRQFRKKDNSKTKRAKYFTRCLIDILKKYDEYYDHKYEALFKKEISNKYLTLLNYSVKSFDVQLILDSVTEIKKNRKYNKSISAVDILKVVLNPFIMKIKSFRSNPI